MQLSIWKYRNGSHQPAVNSSGRAKRHSRKERSAPAGSVNSKSRSFVSLIGGSRGERSQNLIIGASLVRCLHKKRNHTSISEIKAQGGKKHIHGVTRFGWTRKRMTVRLMREPALGHDDNDCDCGYLCIGKHTRYASCRWGCLGGGLKGGVQVDQNTSGS